MSAYDDDTHLFDGRLVDEMLHSSPASDEESDMELSDDELRAIADEANEWADNGNYVNAPLDPDNPHSYLYMSSEAHSYYTGVIGERKRSCDTRALATILARELLAVSTAIQEHFGTEAADVVSDYATLLDKCRAAGLLPSE